MQALLFRLRSRRGASFIIAMVFFMLCFFVGGTVLAAASANGGRLSAQTQRQQTALTQRSAAQVLQTQLQLPDGALNRLEITNVKTTVTTTSNESGATQSTTAVSYKVTFYAPEKATGIQRVLYEAAVRCYMDAYAIPATAELSFVNFSFGGTQSNLSSFFPAQGELSVTLTEGGDTVSTVSAYYQMGTQAQKNLGTFTLVLGDESADDSVLSLYMKATVKVDGNATREEESKTIDNVRIETAVDTTVDIITWTDPVVRKGGASE